MDNITIKEFYNKLRFHDWNYNYSDDPRVYREGLASSSNLRCYANQSIQHKILYNQFLEYIQDETGKTAKPECPE